MYPLVSCVMCKSTGPRLLKVRGGAGRLSLEDDLRSPTTLCAQRLSLLCRTENRSVVLYEKVQKKGKVHRHRVVTLDTPCLWGR